MARIGFFFLYISDLSSFFIMRNFKRFNYGPMYKLNCVSNYYPSTLRTLTKDRDVSIFFFCFRNGIFGQSSR